MDKRYQVFVSSTYADLKDERRAVIQTLMEMDCIPAGMELFPAADEDQWEFIRRVIDDCDYYLLIIGGRYGSLTAEGISYTEKEYDYAVSRGLRVIALVHGAPDEIPSGKVEILPELREKLSAFREKVCTGRLVRSWTHARELPGLLALSLSKTMRTYPAVGWVRATSAASSELLLEINELRKVNAALQADLAERTLAGRPHSDDVARGDDTVRLRGDCTTPEGEEPWDVDLTWNEVISWIGPHLFQLRTEFNVKELFQRTLSEVLPDGYKNIRIDREDFITVKVQLLALGIIECNHDVSSPTWWLTPHGYSQVLLARSRKKADV